MTFNIEAMRRNRDAGTQAPWQLIPTGSHDGWNGWGLANQPNGFMRGYTSVIADIRGPQDNTNRASDASRIASVPSMEAEIERLTARVAELAPAIEACKIIDVAMKTEYPTKTALLLHLLKAVEPARAALSTPTEEPKT